MSAVAPFILAGVLVLTPAEPVLAQPGDLTSPRSVVAQTIGTVPTTSQPVKDFTIMADDTEIEHGRRRNGGREER